MADGDIDTASVTQLIRAVEERKKYAFLIGAGSSRPAPAEIPTGGELIEKWKGECYDHEAPGEEFEAWVEAKEEGMDDDNEYGFWFEQRHPTRGERRERIQELVEGATPTFGHVLLASLMDEDYVPHVLTPNFDDLLFDAFYLYLEDKPQLIDHRAVAPEFSLTHSESAIVKLHGDYLYDNLRNTAPETEGDALEDAMRDALQQTVEEYGLVVVGYSGGDNSIMDPLINADLSEYGVFWCTRDANSFSDEPKAEELLSQPNTYLVEIEGFGSLMRKFGNRIDDVEPPEPTEITERAKERADMLRGALEESKEETADEEEEEYVDKTEKWWEGRLLAGNGNYEEAIECYDEALEQDPEYTTAYISRGNAKQEIGKCEEAIADYDKALDLDPEYAEAYNNRGNAKKQLGEVEAAMADYDKALDFDPEYAEAYSNRGTAKAKLGEVEAAIADYDKALDLDPYHTTAYQNSAEARIQKGNYEQALQDAEEAFEVSESTADSAQSLLLRLIPQIVLGEDVSSEESEYRSLCNEEFTTMWNFEGLDTWLADTDLEAEKKDKIEELIDLLRQHKE